MKSWIQQIGCGALFLTLSGCGGDANRGSGDGQSSRSTIASSSRAKSNTSSTTTKAAAIARKPAPGHAVYSLFDNRLSAHVFHQDSLVIWAGSAGFAKYLRFAKSKIPWEMGTQIDGRKVAVMKGVAGIHVPMHAEHIANSQSLRMRVYSETEGAVTIRFNGDRKAEVNLPVQTGWSTISAPIAKGLFTRGNNEVLLFTRRGAKLAVEWFTLGNTAAETPWALRAQKDKTLEIPRNRSLTYYVMVPKAGMLAGDVSGETCNIEVEARPQSGRPMIGQLNTQTSWIDLASLSEQVVRLEIRTRDCPTAHIANAALHIAGARPSFTRSGDKPKYVVLWIMDSLRADRLKPFIKSARPEVPVFSKLAKNSALFAQTYVQGNESRSSHASIWSSVYPVNHAMFTHRSKLGPKWVTIDEVAKSAKLYTSGVSGNGYVIPRRGFGTKWDAFRNHIHTKESLSGKSIMEAGIASIQERKTPWFLYLGTIDTHVSWRAKQPWFSKYDPKPYKGHFTTKATGPDMGKAAGVKGEDWPWGKANRARDIERIIAIYDSNVSYQDDLLGQFLAKLEEWKIRSETMIVITSDHGDEQWEAGRVGHGGSLRESLIHVPLLIHYPPLFPGSRVEEGAEVVDIVPTIADALGVKPDPSWQGESLLAISNGIGRGYPRLSMASHVEIIHAARIGPWKLRAAGAQTPRLYRLDKDPRESENIVGKNPLGRQFVEDALWMLRVHNKSWKKSRWGNPANVTAHFAADLSNEHEARK